MSDRTNRPAVLAALTASFEALATYDRGSGRGALQPIDDAMAAASADEVLRAEIESRLIAIVRGPGSLVAKEYACGRLALIGGPASVAALAEVLPSEALAHAALNALQVMPSAEAGAALRRSLPSLAGMPLAGALTALGLRREAEAVEAVAAYLNDETSAVAVAAAGALGEIATPAAADLLAAFVSRAPASTKSAVRDAALVAAERCKAAGDRLRAKALLDALSAGKPPAHVNAAAARIEAL